jgi:hypothetical protein
MVETLRMLPLPLLAALTLAACQTSPSPAPPAGASTPPALAAAPASVTPAAALAGFRGYWQGATNPGSPARDASILIEDTPGGGFSVTWRNFAAATDHDAASPILERENSLTFVPSGRPGLWRAAGAGDPVTGSAAWATIAGDVLTVDVIAVDDEGDLERQTYVRTLTPAGMDLLYRRTRDGDPERVIEAEYMRISE